MGHYDNRVAAGKVNPNAGVDTAVDEQIDNTLTRINTKLQEKFGGGTAKSMLIGLEQFEENLEAMDDHRPLLAVNSAGQPAQQLPSGGTSSPASPQGQLTDDERKFLTGLRNASLTKGQFAAINKIVVGATEVDEDGNLTEVDALKAELEKQRKTLQNELDKVRQELADTKDPKKTGSLAHQLDVEKSKAGTSSTKVIDEYEALAGRANDLLKEPKSNMSGGKTVVNAQLASVEQWKKDFDAVKKGKKS